MGLLSLGSFFATAFRYLLLCSSPYVTISAMLCARVCLLAFFLGLTSLLLAKEEPAIVMLWPSQGNASLKLSFGRFRSVAAYEGKLTLVSDVVIENLSLRVMPQASFSVFLLDKDHVRIGNGLLVVNDLNPGESAKVLFQCDSVGVPSTLSIGAKNNGGVPTSFKTIPLQVISTPAGASLKVDGKDSGMTPTTVNLTVGNHNLELTKDGYGATATPVDIAAEDLPNGSIKITLAGLANDVVNLRDGSSLNGDVMSMDLDSVVIRVDGKDQKIERNQVNKIFLVERILTHISAADAQSKGKTQGATPQTPHQ